MAMWIRPRVKRRRSSAFALSLGLVIVSGVKINGAEELQKLQLLPVTEGLFQSVVDSLLLRLMAAGAADFLDQFLVQHQSHRLTPCTAARPARAPAPDRADQ